MKKAGSSLFRQKKGTKNVTTMTAFLVVEVLLRRNDEGRVMKAVPALTSKHNERVKVLANLH